MQRLWSSRNHFLKSAQNSDLETTLKPFALRHVIKSASSLGLRHLRLTPGNNYPRLTPGNNYPRLTPGNNYPRLTRGDIYSRLTPGDIYPGLTPGDIYVRLVLGLKGIAT